MGQTITQSVGNAFADGEGFGASPTNKPTRTNNPGDIGNTDDGSTVTYPTQEAGYNALYAQTNTFLTGVTPSGTPSSLYNPNMTIAQVANVYTGGVGQGGNLANNVAAKLGVPTSTTMAQIASGQVKINTVPQPQGNGTNLTGSVTGSSTNTAGLGTVNDTDVAATMPVAGMNIPSDQMEATLAAMYPPLVIKSGIAQAPWYADDNILQVDGPTSPVGSPVTFQIFFGSTMELLPITISMVASMRTFQRSMRHVVTKELTRTGVLLNLWGMAPDTINGTASTGLMANQLGVTDFLSLSTVPTYVQQMVIQAFGNDPQDEGLIEGTYYTPGFMRVAAKDAFVEFLSMFKNNGNVWFRNPQYTEDATTDPQSLAATAEGAGVTTSQQQMLVDAWSPMTGSSTFQGAARRNDIMTRGQVVMYFRNTAYYGYFKSLSWVMDAKTPFRWNFNFIFQVESTRTEVGVPNL
jgi:hypothetical protein